MFGQIQGHLSRFTLQPLGGVGTELGGAGGGVGVGMSAAAGSWGSVIRGSSWVHSRGLKGPPDISPRGSSTASSGAAFRGSSWQQGQRWRRW